MYIVYTQKASFFCNRAVTAHAVQYTVTVWGPGLVFRSSHRMRIRVKKVQILSLMPLLTHARSFYLSTLIKKQVLLTMLTTYKRRKNTLLWLSTETNCDCAIWSKTAIWNARREGETYGCGPVRPVSPSGRPKMQFASDGLCKKQRIRRRRIAVCWIPCFSLQQCMAWYIAPLLTAATPPSATSLLVALTRTVVQPRQRKIRCRASDAEKEGRAGVCKKGQARPRPGPASQRPSFPGLVAMAWPCTLLASMLTRRTVIVHSVCLASCHWLLPGSSETWRRGGVATAAAQ